MTDPDPIETIAEVIGGVDYDYEQRDQARRIVSAIRTDFELRRGLWLALTTDNPLSRLNKAPSSPMETTDAPGQRPDHTGVIRRADEAERFNTYLHAISALSPPRRPDHWVKFSTRMAIADACMALADAEAEDQRAAYGFLEVEVAEQIAKVAERNATIERLWRQLNEATNVPARYSVEGAAGPCQSCDQPASTHYHLIGGGCMNSEIQAADDRRSL